MELFTVIYVSESTIPPAFAKGAVEQIVATSRPRNLTLGLTGALLFTGQYFAQVLEGTTTSIDRLMLSVSKDPRHENLIVVAREPIVERRFERWSMAYAGPSQFVASYVTPLLTDPASPRRERPVNWLNNLMWEFAEGQGDL